MKTHPDYMLHSDPPRLSRIRASDFVFPALCIAGLLLLVAVVYEIALYKPSLGEVLGLTAMVLISDACLLFAWWNAGSAVRVLTALGGLVALINTYAVLCYTLQIVF